MTKKIYEPIKEDKKDLLETEEKPVYNVKKKEDKKKNGTQSNC